MKCPKCGNECREDMKFCSNCGYPISVYMEGVKHNTDVRNNSVTQNIKPNDNPRPIPQYQNTGNAVPYYKKNLSAIEVVKWILMGIFGVATLISISQGLVLKSILLLCFVLLLSPIRDQLPIKLSSMQYSVVMFVLFMLIMVAPGNKRTNDDEPQANESVDNQVDLEAETEEQEQIADDNIEDMQDNEEPVEEIELASADSLVEDVVDDETDKDSDDEEVEDDGEKPKMKAAEPLTDDERANYLDMEEIPINQVLVNIASYEGQIVKSTVKVSSCYDLSDEEEGDVAGITQIYFKTQRTGFWEYLENDLWLDDVISLEEDDFVTAVFKIAKNEYDRFELINGRVLETGNTARETFEEDSEKFKADFKSQAESVTHDTLLRYPDSYKGKMIKVTVNITKAEPDGLIFQGDLLGVIPGTKNEIDINDYREVREPRFREGDQVTIYGFGDGLTTINVYEKSGIIPKLIDKYSVPCISVWYIE